MKMFSGFGCIACNLAICLSIWTVAVLGDENGGGGEVGRDGLAEVERASYLAVYENRSFLRRKDVNETKLAIRDISEDSPVPLLIDCVWEFEKARYPRAIHHLNKTAKEMNTMSRFSEPVDLGNGFAFSWDAHLKFLSAELSLHMGEKEKAMDELAEFCKKKYAFSMGLGKSKASEIHLRKQSQLMLTLCSADKAEKAEVISKELLASREELDDDELNSIFWDRSKIIYYKEKDSEKAFNYLNSNKATESDPSYYLPTLALYARMYGNYSFAQRAYNKLKERPTPANNITIYEQKVCEMLLSAGKWTEAMHSLEQSWKRNEGKDRIWEYLTTRNLKLTAARLLFAAGHASTEAIPLVDDLLSNPPRWSGKSDDSIELWMNGVYLLGIASCKEADKMQLDFYRGKGLVKEASAAKNSIIQFQRRTLLWKQAIRANVTNLLTGEKNTFIRDAFHLSGSPPWLWPAFMEVMGPRQMELLLYKYPLIGKRRDLFQNAIDAELAFLREDWPKAGDKSADAYKELPPYEKLLKARMGALMLKSKLETGAKELHDDLIREVYGIQPLALAQLEIPLPEPPDYLDAVKYGTAFQVPEIKAKDIKFLTGKSTRTITPR